MESRIVQEAERNVKLYGYQAKSWHDQNSKQALKERKSGDLGYLQAVLEYWRRNGQLGMKN